MDIPEPRLISQEPMKLVGLEHVGPAENGEIPALWRAFMPRMGEVRRIKDTYGCVRHDPGLVYLVGSQVEDFEAIPSGMVGREVAGGLYASVQCPGLDHLSETLRWFTEDWLPHSSYAAGEGTLEYYPPTFPGEPHFELRFALIPRT